MTGEGWQGRAERDSVGGNPPSNAALNWVFCGSKEYVISVEQKVLKWFWFWFLFRIRRKK